MPTSKYTATELATLNTLVTAQNATTNQGGETQVHFL
jgi:hypothetical protein